MNANSKKNNDEKIEQSRLYNTLDLQLSCLYTKSEYKT